MRMTELYPYWSDAHDEMIELLEWLPVAVWDYRPDANVRSIRQIALHLLDRERFWIVHLAQEGAWDRPLPRDFATPDLLIEGLVAMRKQTQLYVESLKPEMLRAVRSIPTDADTNSPATNRPISWLIWQVLQHEMYHFGQIQMRRYDQAEPGSEARR
ncbi:MAG TPA: DinB family protein [Capsulimonadaceae bacterium]|jgi:uncharacterized damage-inducible protein DinB